MCGIKNSTISLSSIVSDLIKGGVALFVLYLLFSQSSAPSSAPAEKSTATRAETTNLQNVGKKADTVYKNADSDFYGCIKYREKYEKLPFYNKETIGSTFSQLAEECNDTYSPALKACVETGRSNDACKSALADTFFLAVKAAL